MCNYNERGKLMMRCLRCYLVFAIVLVCDSLFGQAVRVENSTSAPLTVWLKGIQDSNWRGPWTVQRNTEMQLPVPPARYRILYRRGNGGFEDLGWQDYSNHKIAYRLVRCAPCEQIVLANGQNANVQKEIHQLSVDVFHSNGEYICPKCGRSHVKWEPGWTKDNIAERGNERDEHGASHPIFEPYGPFRLGVQVLDAVGGVMIASVADGTAAKQMRRMDGADNVTYQLTPGINIITHVNGKRINNSTEFTSAVSESPQRLEVTVYNTDRGSARDYATTLAY